MRTDRERELLAALRSLIDSGPEAAPTSSSELEGLVDDLLAADESVELAAALGAQLDRARRALEGAGRDDEVARALARRVASELTRRVTREARREARDYEQTLAKQILDALAARPRSPTELAAILDVHVTQISRAARRLKRDGRLAVVVDADDKRRRLYVAARPPQGTRKPFSDVVDGALRRVRPSEVVSDLLPGRVGDRLPADRFQTVISALRDDLGDAGYEPTAMHVVDIPKQGGGTRPAAALRYSDRLLYAALVARCRDAIEAHLGDPDQVLWPRGHVSEKRWIELESFVAHMGAPYVLAVDVQSFYDSVRHDVLEEALLRAGCDSAVVRALVSWLGTICGGPRGLPQGLPPSDPLASVVLAPLDRALRSATIEFVRHGDDLRCAVRSHAEAQEVERLVGSELRALELPINHDKTRTLRKGTYLKHRTEVSTAVAEYLSAHDLSARSDSMYTLLRALGADLELQWGWYHGNLGVTDVLERVGGHLQPGDEQALLLVLDAVAEEQDRLDHWRATPLEERRTLFLLRASMSLLAASGVDEGADHLPPWLVGRPEYADALSLYVESVASKNPAAVAHLLERIEESGVAYDGQWLRLYAALGSKGTRGEFDSLARGHASSDARSWMLRLRAATFMAERDRPGIPAVPLLIDGAPPALKDDVLHLVSRAEPQLLPQMLSSETRVTAALLAA